MASLRPRDTYDPDTKADSRSGREGSVQNFSGERSASPFPPPSALHPFLSAWDSSRGQRDSKAECQAPGSPSGPTFPPGGDRALLLCPPMTVGLERLFWEQEIIQWWKVWHTALSLSVLCPAICLGPMGKVLCFRTSEEFHFQ